MNLRLGDHLPPEAILRLSIDPDRCKVQTHLGDDQNEKDLGNPLAQLCAIDFYTE